MSFIKELKRRNVFKIAVAYAIVAWLSLQVSDTLVPALHLPEWFNSGVVFVLIIGFPIALIFAWAFEMTPEGIRKEKDLDRSASTSPRKGPKLNLGIVALLVVTLAYVAYDKLVLDGLLETPPELGSDPFSQPTSGQPTETIEKRALTPVEAIAQDEAATSKKSIVVLPFVNMSNDPEQEFFSDGLSEELLNVLAQIKDLRVISRTSAFAFKGKDLDIPTIAAQLNVTHVLEGSVRKSGEDVRITAQLIEVATDSHLWSDAYNRKLDNIFEIQEEISKAIAKELQVTLGTGGKSSKPTDNLEAWQLFLRGRHLYQNRGDEQLARSIDLLNQAVALDPDFAEAWANLAAANIVYSYGRRDGFESLLDNGHQAALRAIEIDPENGFAHAVLGMILAGGLAWDDAIRELDLAISLNPNETNSLLWKGIILMNLGYIDQAKVILQQAEKLDPVFTNLQLWLSNTAMIKGDYESMHRRLQKILQLDPGFRSANDVEGEYELFIGNLDGAEQLARASDLEKFGSDILAAAMFSALRDPANKDQAVATLLANEDLVIGGDLTGYLWRIGATEETLANIQRMRKLGRHLRALNNLSTLWAAYDRAQLSNPAVTVFFEDIGLADYWRKHGNPDYCRVNTDNSISCGEL